MACGTPIIAYKAGGVLDTLTDDVALFFNAPTKNCLEEAILSIHNKPFQKDKLIERAHAFDKHQFVTNFQSEVKAILDKLSA